MCTKWCVSSAFSKSRTKRVFHVLICWWTKNKFLYTIITVVSWLIINNRFKTKLILAHLLNKLMKTNQTMVMFYLYISIDSKLYYRQVIKNQIIIYCTWYLTKIYFFFSLNSFSITKLGYSKILLKNWKRFFVYFRVIYALLFQLQNDFWREVDNRSS